MWRQTAGSVLCPACGQLVGVKDEECLSCGRRHPGMWGFAALLRNTGSDLGFTGLVLWTCGAVFLASLAVDFEGIGRGGLLSLLSPSLPSLFISHGAPTFALAPGRIGPQLTALGARFDLKGFHDTMLANGAVPLTVLERIMADWTAQRR